MPRPVSVIDADHDAGAGAGERHGDGVARAVDQALDHGPQGDARRASILRSSAVGTTETMPQSAA